MQGVVGGFHPYHLDYDGVANILVYGTFPEIGFRLWFAMRFMMVMTIGSIATVVVMVMFVVAATII